MELGDAWPSFSSVTRMPHSLCANCASRHLTCHRAWVLRGLTAVLAPAQSTMNMMSFSSSYRGGRSVPGQPRDTALDG